MATCLLRERWGALFLEHGRLVVENDGVYFIKKNQKLSLPVQRLLTVCLGAGTTVTFKAVDVVCASGCLLCWFKGGGSRIYASTLPNGSSDRLQRQLDLYASPDDRGWVARRFFSMRFGEELPEDYDIQRILAAEGRRMKQAYAEAAASYGVPWNGRAHDDWNGQDAINKTLSIMNGILYDFCHAAILAVGASAAIGFLHQGHHRSFVYDIADLFKVDVVFPFAFSYVSNGGDPDAYEIRGLAASEFCRADIVGKAVKAILEVLDADYADK